MDKLNRDVIANLHFERQGIERIYTRSMSSIERVELDEIRRLDLSLCPACRTPIATPKFESADVVGGKHFDYQIYNCDWCGWWTIFKFRVTPRTDEIHWAEQMRTRSEFFKSLSEFDYYEPHPEVRLLMKALAKENERIGTIPWTAFEMLAKAYLLDHGMYVADISRIRSSGGDFLCVDTEGKVILVEVKHLTREPVSIGAVWKVVGVITTEGLDGGMIITSHRLSPDAITLMERGSIGLLSTREERRDMRHVERVELIKWLQEVQAREHQQMLSTISGAIADDAMMEM